MMNRQKLQYWKTGIFIFSTIFIAAACLHIFMPPDSALFPAIVPDGTENALAAWDFVHNGRFGFLLNGIWHPSRYPIWLPLTFFAPGVLLSGGNLMGGVYGVFASVIVIFLCLLLCGKKSGNIGAGLLSIPLLITYRGFITLSNAAMSEIPYTALLMILLVLLLETVRKKDLSFPLLLGAGIIGAWTGSLRPTGYPMLLPFLILVFLREKTWKRRALLWSMILLPSVMIAGCTLFYQYRLFGTPFRTGYHYWCPVPYDFPQLPFQWKFFHRFCYHFFHSPAFPVLLTSLALGSLYMLIRRKKKTDRMQYRMWLTCFLYGLFQECIVCGLYCTYCGTVSRYFLAPSVILLFSAAGAFSESILLLARFCSRRKIVLSFSFAAFVCLTAVSAFFPGEKIPVTYAEIELLKFCEKNLPEDAVWISCFNPALTSFYLHRKQIPFSRELEYAGKAVSPESIGKAMQCPQNDDDHFAALEAYPAKKVSLPFPVVIAESFPAVIRRNHGRKWYLKEALEGGKTYMTSMALWQIPARYRERFLKETRLVKTAAIGPVELYHILPQNKNTTIKGDIK